MNILEKIKSAKDLTEKQGIYPIAIFIHPDHKQELGDVKEVFGMRIIIPSSEDMAALLILHGFRFEGFSSWDKDQAYLVDWQALNSVFKLRGQAPHILYYCD